MTNGQKEASCHVKGINSYIQFLKKTNKKTPKTFFLVFNVRKNALSKQMHVLSFIIHSFIYKYLLSSHSLQALLQTLGQIHEQLNRAKSLPS